jgi:hypothetical protein
MMHLGLILSLIVLHPVPDQPLGPAWSPDHEVFATTQVPQAFVTPAGGNYSLLFNGKVVYPHKTKRAWFAAYENQHTFLSPMVWSPDSQHLAFVEKVYDWEYSDPFNRDFEGRVSNQHFYLVIVSRDGQASGYVLDRMPTRVDLRWKQADQITLNGRCFDLQANSPKPIP